MEALKKVFITGCNRGLGKQFVKIAAKNSPKLELHISSRAEPKELRQQFQGIIPGDNLHCYQLNIDDTNNIKSTVQEIQNKKIHFDYVIANAARGFDFGTQPPSGQLAESYMNTNLNATIEFVKQFLPLLTPQGRLIIVSTAFSRLNNQTQYMQKLLRNSHITEEEILEIGRKYVAAAKKGDMGNFSWTAYGTSKALLNAWARFVLPKYLKEGQTVLVMHPGWCQTDMGGPQATLSSEEGGQRIYDCLWVKQLEVDKFYNQKFVSYETCQ